MPKLPGIPDGCFPLRREIASFRLKSEVAGTSKTIHQAQFPLELAYALTAHKAQGMTLEKVIVDLADMTRGSLPWRFLYMILSRVSKA
ncbi:hypothetical protein H9P43_009396 [Blastocladiella emersonii ATCC 22665]|nr:hypothetical protein H9P43_009396 [Blastocladiella emersonii ATCC 22665]